MRGDRRPNRTRGAIVWLTGLSGAGKSTLARGLEHMLNDCGHCAVALDGDALRRSLSADLGFSPADRSEHSRRVAEVARLFADIGVVAIAALISPPTVEIANGHALSRVEMRSRLRSSRSM